MSSGQAALLVVGLMVLVALCALFQRRPRPDAYSHEELRKIRINRELAKESILEEKAQRLKGRARIHKHIRMALTARKDADFLLKAAQEQWDARGRSIYGDAWDDPEDGNLPLRSLFNLPKEEIDFVREEAVRLLQSGAGSDFLSRPAPPRRGQLVDGDAWENLDLGARKPGTGNGEHRAMTASARRGPAYSRPSTDTPFIDTRFVHVPTPAFVPPLDFTRLIDEGKSRRTEAIPRPPTAATTGFEILHDRTALPAESLEGINPMRLYPVASRPPAQSKPARAVDRHDFSKRGSPAIPSSFQAPGLTHPRPPEIPVPESARKNQSLERRRESLSARLLRVAAGDSSSRVVPVEFV